MFHKTNVIVARESKMKNGNFVATDEWVINFMNIPLDYKTHLHSGYQLNSARYIKLRIL